MKKSLNTCLFVLILFCTLGLTANNNPVQRGSFEMRSPEPPEYRSEHTGEVLLKGYSYGYPNTSTTQVLGLISFSPSSPTQISSLGIGGAAIMMHSGEYFEGMIYGQTNTYSEEYGDYIVDKFISIDPESGRITELNSSSSPNGLHPNGIIWDMAYSYKEEVLYGIARSGTGPMLVTVKHTNPNAGVPVPLGVISNGPIRYATLACHILGELYAIGDDGNLYKIDPNELTATRIGHTGVVLSTGPIQNLQTMSFDHNTHNLYWACEDGNLYNVDINSGRARLVGMVGGPVFISALYSDYVEVNDGAPGIPQSLVARSGSNAEISLVLRWMNPTEDAQGRSEPTMTAVKVYRNNVLVHTINNPAVGREESWQDTGVTAGDHVYKVVAENNNGVGIPLSVLAVVGFDFPQPATGVKLEKTSDGRPKVTWTRTTQSVSGGHLGNVTYDIVRLPDNTTVATGLTGSEFTDVTPTTLASYSYKVTAKNERGASEPATSNRIVFGVATIPWSDDLEDSETYAYWTAIDNDNSGNGTFDEWLITGAVNNSSSSGTHSFQFFPFTTSVDDWLITPPLALEGGKTYRLRLSSYSNDTGPSNFSIYMGRSNTPAYLVTKVADFTSQSVLWTEHVFTLPVQRNNNTFYIGFYLNNRPPHVWLDDFFVEEVQQMDVAAVGISRNSSASVGRQLTSTIEVKNFGLTDATNFTVSIYDSNNNVLGTSTAYTGTLAYEESVQIPVNWTPRIAGEEQEIRAVVNMTGDQDLSNNSINQTFNVTNTGELIVSPSDFYKQWFFDDMPFTVLNRAGVAETVFLKEEMKSFGYINSVTYYAGFTQSIENVHVQVYMGTTEKTDALYWAPEEELKLVFDGNISIEKSDTTETGYRIPREIPITFDTPFLYDRNNLVVRTVKIMGATLGDERFMSARTQGTNQPYKSAVFGSNTQSFNYQPGSRVDRYAAQEYKMNVNGHTLTGTVNVGGTPLEGVRVKVVDTEFETLTDADGNYSFGFLLSGDYTVQFYKRGYREVNRQITMTHQRPITSNVNMQIQSTATVTGKVSGDNGALDKAFVALISDNEKYYAFTDQSGNYIFEDVSANDTYILSASYSGYIGKEQEVIMETAGKTIPEIILSSCNSASVTNLTYSLHSPSWYNVQLSWEAPSTDQIKGYRVYRNDELITYELVTSTTFAEEVPAGNYVYEVSAVWKNDCESRRTALTSIEMEIYACDVAVTEYPYKESFDGAIGDCWMQELVWGLTFNWSLVRQTEMVPYTPHSGTHFMRFFENGGGTRVRLITPMFNIKDGLTKPVVSFWHAQGNWGYQDYLRIYYKNSPDGEWILIKEFLDKIENWQQDVIDLPNPTETYWIAFEGEINYGRGVALDDVMVSDDICQPVRNLRYTQENATSVQLIWDQPDGFDISSYKVYRDNVVIKEYIDETTFTDTNLEPGTTYVYDVVAVYNKQECQESPKENISIRAGKFCDPVDRVELSIESANSVKIKWNKPNAYGVDSYSVFRAGNKITEEPAETLEYTDTNVAEGYYEYSVIVNYQDADCEESDPTYEGIMMYTSEVGNLNTQVDFNSKVTLTWQLPVEDIAAFDIYRMVQNANGDYNEEELLGTTRTFEFIDRSVQAGMKYKYMVRTKYDAGWNTTGTMTSEVSIECIQADKAWVALDTENGNDVARLTWTMSEEAPESRSSLLWDNGPFITQQGVGFNGADISEAFAEQGTIRSPLSQTMGYALADDITLYRETHISEIEFYIIMTNANLTPCPISAMYVAIYDGNPAQGGTKIWGDFEGNNVFKDGEFSNVFRTYLNSLMVELPIFNVRAEINTTLPAGKYWIVVSAGPNDMYGTPYALPVTIEGTTTTGNAWYRRLNVDSELVWIPYTAESSGGSLGVPFKVFGEETSLFNIYRDGVLIAENVRGYSYIDRDISNFGSHTWEIAHVCPGGESGKVIAQVVGVGIENTASGEVQVYPNPAKSLVAVEGENIEKIEIFNLTGQLIANIRGNGQNKQEVDLNNYSAGMYLFKIYLNNNKTIVKNVIVID